eukprot:1827154-Prymnesium_polylepis.1
MVDAGEEVSAALRREFKEETGNLAREEDVAAFGRMTEELFRNGVHVYRGYVDDPRNTDSAWLETSAFHFHCPKALGEMLPLHAGDDAANVQWIDIDMNEARGAPTSLGPPRPSCTPTPWLALTALVVVIRAACSACARLPLRHTTPPPREPHPRPAAASPSARPPLSCANAVCAPAPSHCRAPLAAGSRALAAAVRQPLRGAPPLRRPRRAGAALEPAVQGGGGVGVRARQGPPAHRRGRHRLASCLRARLRADATKCVESRRIALPYVGGARWARCARSCLDGGQSRRRDRGV